jgi:hypothetical protein
LTVRCTGGTSAPKPGTEAVVRYTAGLLGAIFAAYDLVWLIPVIPFVGLADLPLASFCATDTPAMPTFTQAEINAFNSFNITSPDWLPGLAKLKDAALNLIWTDACECTTGTVIPVAAPTQPAGSATPIYVPTAIGKCGTDSRQVIGLNQAAGSKSTFGLLPAGLNITTAVFRVTLTNNTAGGAYALDYSYQDADTTVHNFNILPSVTPPVLSSINTVNFPKPIRPQSLTLRINGPGNPTDHTDALIAIDAYCNGVVPTLQQPCCPPDPSANARLDAILNMVTLLQRQLAPFAYIEGSVHAGLSGSGTIAIQGLLGVKVDVTTLPGSLGESGVLPVELFDVGYVTFGTSAGYQSSNRIEHDPQIIVPPRGSIYTTLAYDLHPGVAATITELGREP